jgi:hypothetical protein
MTKPKPKKLYIPKEKKLFPTIKEHIFDFLKDHPEVKRGADLKKIFPMYETPTIYAYLREFHEKNNSEVRTFIPHINRVLKTLANKYVIERQLSIKEIESIRLLGEWVDEYKEIVDLDEK